MLSKLLFQKSKMVIPYVELSFTTIFKKSKATALYVDHSFKKLVLNCLCFFWFSVEKNGYNHFFLLKTSRNAMKHMMLSTQMRGDVISGCYDSKKIFWIRSVSGLTGGGRQSLKPKSYQKVLNVPMDGGRSTV